MSAFMCQEGTIDDVVTLLVSVRLAHAQDASEWGQRLMKLNAESMRQRYPQIDGTEEYYDYLTAAEAYEYPGPVPGMAVGQLVQSTRCWSYQSCEGNCDKAKLYLLVDAACDKLAERIEFGERQSSMFTWDRMRDAT